MSKRNKKTNDKVGIIEFNPNQNINIVHADCMVELAQLPENSIDCVITDPPYFIDKLDNPTDHGTIYTSKNGTLQTPSNGSMLHYHHTYTRNGH